MNMSMDFKKVHNKILGHMKAFDVTVDHILVHFVGSKLGLYVSFRIPLYLFSQIYMIKWSNQKSSFPGVSFSGTPWKKPHRVFDL